ncbi:DUF4232 domain-containing protein [Glycomyces algeriensis]|uniref:DUF4232 domain-containing protein n=1 Tax=Glycomyces algeriensis TaxID=256037 RepID=A0A9W6GB68_9ACTN|nr:DUF4232 domain-containing protein [Glycomyces algeriensis]MDA1368842.1 DUF4232 domain-containing protein [Glycomyces algeriensis]MDR7350858.1 hypothetical protein [Glycomyces algeriensis]GLI43569.1 hypothetical protein GALLR39Z86_34190 [Glycomyces algeriensis]
MPRISRPLALIAAVLALAAAGCGADAGGDAGGEAVAATSTECDEHGIQMSLTPTAKAGDRTFMAIGLVNCGETPLLLDSMPQVGVFGGNVVAPRDHNAAESITVDPGQGAIAPLSWEVATRTGDVLEVDRFLINALPVTAGYELDLAEPVELNADHELDLGAWQLTGVPAAEVDPVEPATDRPEEPQCPEGGFHVTVTQGDAAMGLRTSGIELVNCGTEDIAIDGYPVIEIPGVEIAVRQGSDTLQDPGPTSITLAPGASVSAGMLWTNRVESGDAVNATEINVGYAEGSPLETVTPEAPIDLGTTREIEVTAWSPAD